MISTMFQIAYGSLWEEKTDSLDADTVFLTRTFNYLCISELVLPKCSLCLVFMYFTTTNLF